MTRGNVDLVASVVISTYNRAEALRQTVEALADQAISPSGYEVIVVNDGSTDETRGVLDSVATPYTLRAFHQPENRGVSAGRNVGIRAARGRYLIFLSDDLIVPRNFIRAHVELLESSERSWVVGGFRQLDELGQTPFGRYLDLLERGFEEGRKGPSLGPGLWEMEWPTARNLSLPRTDLDEIGLFDERFRTTCEDQDLAERARAEGIRFIYDASIECLHNDQAGDLERYCRFQRRGASDTVLLLAKSPALHGGAEIAKVNGRLSRRDSPRDAIGKLVKATLAIRPVERGFRGAISVAERLGVPERWLRRAYRVAIGTALFRGWRQGLRLWGDPLSVRTQAEVRAGWQPERSPAR